MWRGLYTAAAGMNTEMVRTDTISNNLANANTSGYKKDNTVDREFEPMLIQRINDYSQEVVTSFKGFSIGRQAPVVGRLGLGSYVREVATDHAQGTFQSTGNKLDLAISGEGYFAVATPQGVRYTRDGNFRRSATGQLVTSNGQAVLNRTGRPINIPEDVVNINIGAEGMIYDGNIELEQLQFVQFDGNRAVLKQGDSLYYASYFADKTFNPFVAYPIVAGYFILLTLGLTAIFGAFNRRLNRHLPGAGGKMRYRPNLIR